jgi:hypothetical protein
MLKTALETELRVAGRDGVLGHLAFIGSVDQASRWINLGYDVSSALERQRDFAKTFSTTGDFRAAGRLLRQFVSGELGLAIAQGVPADDPDLGRIEASAKAWHWEPARAVV